MGDEQAVGSPPDGHPKAVHPLVREMVATQLPHGAIALWYLGQAGFAIRAPEGVVYIDPYLSDYIAESGRYAPAVAAPRAFPPPVPAAAVTNAWLWLGSHDHADHIDPVAVAQVAVASPDATFVVPVPAVATLVGLGVPERRVVRACVGAPLRFGGVTITPLASPHEERETSEGHQRYLGYVVDVAGVRLYHAGDCVADEILVEELAALAPDVVCLPINGRDWLRKRRGIMRGNMGFREAADLAAAVGADLAIPMHFDLMPVNAENPVYFADYVLRTYPTLAFYIMRPGERLVYMARPRSGRA